MNGVSWGSDEKSGLKPRIYIMDKSYRTLVSYGEV